MAIMLKAVASVAAELGKKCAPHEMTVEMIVAMFKAKTVLDEIFFVQFDLTAENPIWGEFTRWRYKPGVYAGYNTAAEIRYAKHLLSRPEWLRFVITKELCHSLEAPEGVYEVANGTVDELVTKFSLYSHAREVAPVPPAYELEILAEIAAVELLCPVAIREAYLAEHGAPDAAARAKLAQAHNLPDTVVGGAFDASYNSSIRDLLNGD